MDVNLKQYSILSEEKYFLEKEKRIQDQNFLLQMSFPIQMTNPHKTTPLSRLLPNSFLVGLDE